MRRAAAAAEAAAAAGAAKGRGLGLPLECWVRPAGSWCCSVMGRRRGGLRGCWLLRGCTGVGEWIRLRLWIA